MLRISSWILPVVASFLVACGGTGLNVSAIDPKQKPEDAVASLEADLAKAGGEQVEALSPKWFKRALESAALAKRLLERKRSPDEILRAAATGKGELKKATEIASLCRATIPDALKARADAVSAGAPSIKKPFKEAEGSFRELTKAIEHNDVLWAKKREPAVVDRYRSLEATAIRESTIGEARTLIAAARKEGAALSLPKTLAMAEGKLKQVDGLVVKTPEDRQKLMTEAKEAHFEAKRLAALHKEIRTQQGIPSEETLLRMEGFLTRVASSLTAADFRDREFAAQVEAIRAAADALKKDQDVVNAKTRTQEDEIKALREKLAKVEAPPPKKP